MITYMITSEIAQPENVTFNFSGFPQSDSLWNSHVIVIVIVIILLSTPLRAFQG